MAVVRSFVCVGLLRQLGHQPGGGIIIQFNEASDSVWWFEDRSAFINDVLDGLRLPAFTEISGRHSNQIELLRLTQEFCGKSQQGGLVERELVNFLNMDVEVDHS